MIDTFRIKTSMGKYFGELPFLSEVELEEFNNIGYSGETSDGKKMSREAYLNSLKNGEFKVIQTKYDTASFEDEFIIIRVY